MLQELSPDEVALINEAKELIKKRESDYSCVASVLKTNKGNKYYGVNIELKVAPTSICAEYSAIGSMVTNGDNGIDIIVAVWLNNGKITILPPCGQCRHFISKFGDPFVIVEKNGKIGKTKLSNLYPFPVD